MVSLLVSEIITRDVHEASSNGGACGWLYFFDLWSIVRPHGVVLRFLVRYPNNYRPIGTMARRGETHEFCIVDPFGL
jgi:hypothetical protein